MLMSLKPRGCALTLVENEDLYPHVNWDHSFNTYAKLPGIFDLSPLLYASVRERLDSLSLVYAYPVLAMSGMRIN